MTDHKCLLPPPPPGKPPSPPTACTPADVAGQRLNCLEHGGCCEEEGYSCFRKHGSGRRGYARCMTECPERDDWSCEVITLPKPRPPPPPHVGPPCAADYAACIIPRCCLSGNLGCHKRAGRDFAMCKPLHCTGDNCSCVDDETWLCPGWEERFLPSPPPPPPSPPSPRPPDEASTPQAAPQPSSAPPESPALVGVVATAAVLAVLCSTGGVMWWCRRDRLRAAHGVELEEVQEPESPKRKRFAARLAPEDAGTGDDPCNGPAERGGSETTKLNARSAFGLD